MNTLLQHIPAKTKRVAATSGGEYAGPCPRCGGRDRFRIWPEHPKSDSGRFWCRCCDWSGDGIDLLRETGHTFAEACWALGLGYKVNSDATGGQRRAQRPEAKRESKPPKLLRPPGEAWQKQAGAFVRECQRQLWRGTRRAAGARSFLEGRGLRPATIRAAGLGVNPTTRYPLRTSWGLEPREEKPGGGQIWLPRGIVIPWWKPGKPPDCGMWKFRIRRPDGDLQKKDDPKYVQAAAVRPASDEEPEWSSNALYGARALTPGRAAVLVEGVFDALAIMQEARTDGPFPAGRPLVAAAACGTAGARKPHWIAKLVQCCPVLLAFDADEAGEKAASYWQGVLPEATRHAPAEGFGDPADMLESGADVGAWVWEGLPGDVMIVEDEVT